MAGAAEELTHVGSVQVRGYEGGEVLRELSGRLARAADPPSADSARAGAS